MRQNHRVLFGPHQGATGGANERQRREQPPLHLKKWEQQWWQQLLCLPQVTTVTPLGENFCSSSSAPAPPAVRISELCLAGGATSHRFVELEGKPGTSLGGLSLVFFSGKGGKARASVPLRGTVGPAGLFVLALDGGHGHGEADGTDLARG